MRLTTLAGVINEFHILLVRGKTKQTINKQSNILKDEDKTYFWYNLPIRYIYILQKDKLCEGICKVVPWQHIVARCIFIYIYMVIFIAIAFSKGRGRLTLRLVRGSKEGTNKGGNKETKERRKILMQGVGRKTSAIKMDRSGYRMGRINPKFSIFISYRVLPKNVTFLI